MCRTECGLTTEYYMSETYCQRLKQAEKRFIEIAPQYATEYTSKQLCEAIRGYTVAYKSAPWTKEDGESVLGVADCEIKQVTLQDPFLPNGTFFHELFHAVEKCEGDHSDWDKRGICMAIFYCSGGDNSC